MKNLKFFAILIVGIFCFAGLQAQEVAKKDQKSSVKRGALTYQEVVDQFEHFPQIESTGDAKADAQNHRKAMMEWQQKYPEEYKDFVKKMKANTELTEEAKKKAQEKQDAATKESTN